eukprot:900725-Pyramimonas_sp.AAC.1
MVGAAQNASLTLYRITQQGEKFDPICECTTLLVKRYASMIWDSAVSISDVYYAWRCAADRFAQAKPNWQLARGPVASV